MCDYNYMFICDVRFCVFYMCICLCKDVGLSLLCVCIYVFRCICVCVGYIYIYVGGWLGVGFWGEKIFIFKCIFDLNFWLSIIIFFLFKS